MTSNQLSARRRNPGTPKPCTNPKPKPIWPPDWPDTLRIAAATFTDPPQDYADTYSGYLARQPYAGLYTGTLQGAWSSMHLEIQIAWEGPTATAFFSIHGATPDPNEGPSPTYPLPGWPTSADLWLSTSAMSSPYGSAAANLQQP